MMPCAPIKKHAVVIGLGISGMAAVRLLKDQGYRVTGVDENKPNCPGICDQITGELSRDLAENTELLVLSPGVDPRREAVSSAAEKGIPAIGEMALGLRFLSVPFVAVTGTNGKSTVTELIGAMLAASGKTVFTGGNLGTPLCDFVREGCPADIAVLEISSYQLDTLESFRPDVAVLLNITPDHLDRYSDLEAYAASKARIFRDMNAGTAVLNYGDTRVRSIGEKLPLTRRWYDREERGIQIDEKGIHLEDGSFIDLQLFSLPGRHNRENLAAAWLAAEAAGASREGIIQAIREFKGLEHRMTPCGSIRGIPCYDDSKATNMDAVCRALAAFDREVVLIMGGRDKGGDYRLMEQCVRTYARAIILIGEASEALYRAFHLLVPCEKASDLDEAVRMAAEKARPHTPILLSPACASFDMFRDYKDRGNQFRAIVARHALSEDDA
ncbi:UDP-N-acetylmuramoyl-L-alanine--D-glutamate ligase [Desulfobotulus sp. H1]|uniref:UDP-N-acetylmuramoylalanine--D-glutamate ligase n=1 Tax=Desulfobotulus pelophilus TaxID=2823377 RepID=A0ABT3N523_9BACT|nr:UDP-N-acetylmuramoyl-L-alanine--D-glutamate ligase [Desulfobotulus pelophilus]MCW7752556.1 UDP-N-acetylmuramoyl-L-alanine--D-glutamate ligase [Desulfobotulus pelophilus]